MFDGIRMASKNNITVTAIMTLLPNTHTRLMTLEWFAVQILPQSSRTSQRSLIFTAFICMCVCVCDVCIHIGNANPRQYFLFTYVIVTSVGDIQLYNSRLFLDKASQTHVQHQSIQLVLTRKLLHSIHTQRQLILVLPIHTKCRERERERDKPANQSENDKRDRKTYIRSHLPKSSFQFCVRSTFIKNNKQHLLY